MTLANGFNHVATLTDDLDRLLGFYRRVFDADVVFDVAEDGLRHAGVDLGGGAMLHAFHAPWVASEPPGKMFERGRTDHYGITVPTVEALLEVRRRLAAEGDAVTDGQVRDFGPVYSLSFTDPDGVSAEVNLVKGPWDAHPLRPPAEWTVVDLAAQAS